MIDPINIDLNGPSISQKLEQAEVNYDISEVMKHLPNDWSTTPINVPEEDFQTRFEKYQRCMEKRIDELSMVIFNTMKIITPLVNNVVPSENIEVKKEEEKPRALGLTFVTRKNHPLILKDACFIPQEKKKQVFLYDEGKVEWTRKMCANLNQYWDRSWFVDKDMTTRHAQNMTTETSERMDNVEKKLKKQKQIQEVVAMIMEDCESDQARQIALNIINNLK
jgi:hypothetical protein